MGYNICVVFVVVGLVVVIVIVCVIIDDEVFGIGKFVSGFFLSLLILVVFMK